MTAENAADPEPTAAPGSVSVDGFEKIMGTGGRVAASGGRSGKDFEQRIQVALIEPNKRSEQPGDWMINHQGNGEQGPKDRDAGLALTSPPQARRRWRWPHCDGRWSLGSGEDLQIP
jgi:hypothetical protein